MEEIAKSQLTGLSEEYSWAIISSVRKTHTINVEEFLKNILTYFDDKELIDKFNDLEESISSITRDRNRDIIRQEIQIAKHSVEIPLDREFLSFLEGSLDLERNQRDTIAEDLFWETIQECWNIVTVRLGFPVITPWLLESTRNDKNLIRFLGGSIRISDKFTLPVKVIFGDFGLAQVDPNFDWDSLQIFDHEFTEELLVGILIGLNNNEKFQVYMQKVYEFTDGDQGNISLGDLLPNYIEVNRIFTADISSGVTISFDTEDMIRGIVTACKWLNVNPNTIVDNIYQGDKVVTF